jgi:hypothetical protein
MTSTLEAGSFGQRQFILKHGQRFGRSPQGLLGLLVGRSGIGWYCVQTRGASARRRRRAVVQRGVFLVSQDCFPGNVRSGHCQRAAITCSWTRKKAREAVVRKSSGEHRKRAGYRLRQAPPAMLDTLKLFIRSAPQNRSTGTGLARHIRPNSGAARRPSLTPIFHFRRHDESSLT